MQDKEWIAKSLREQRKQATSLDVIFIYKSYLPYHGGIEYLIHTIATELLLQDVSCSVLSLKFSNDLPPVEYINGVKVFRIPAKLFIKNQVDIVTGIHTMMRILREKGQDIVHIFSSIPSSVLFHALNIAKKFKRKIAWHPIFIPGRFNRYKNPIIKATGVIYDTFVVPEIAKKVDIIFTLTSAEATYLKRHTQSIVRVVGECVNEPPTLPKTSLFEILSRYDLTPGTYLLSVGRMTYYKGYDLLLKTWRTLEREYHDLKLVLVGPDAGYRLSIIRMIRNFKLKRVKLLGAVSMDVLNALYDGCLFVVSLSRFETFHRIALEAWSHKKPIVALNLGPATEHIASSNGGFLVNDDLAHIIRTLRSLVENRALRVRLGLNGYTIFKERYTPKAYVGRILESYNEVVQKS